MGLTLGEMFDLEALAADCAADGVWEFLFTRAAADGDRRRRARRSIRWPSSEARGGRILARRRTRVDARHSPALGTRAGNAGRAAERLGRSRAGRRRPAHRGGRGAAHPCARRRGDRRADGRASAGARSLPARPPVSHRHGLQPSRRAARRRARVAQRPVPLRHGTATATSVAARPTTRGRRSRRCSAPGTRMERGRARQRAVPLGAGGGDRVAALRADHPPPSPAPRHRRGDRLGHDLGVAPTTRDARRDCAGCRDSASRSARGRPISTPAPPAESPATRWPSWPS